MYVCSSGWLGGGPNRGTRWLAALLGRRTRCGTKRVGSWGKLVGLGGQEGRPGKALSRVHGLSCCDMAHPRRREPAFTIHNHDAVECVCCGIEGAEGVGATIPSRRGSQVLDGLSRLSKAARSSNREAAQDDGGRGVAGSGTGPSAAALEEEVEVDGFVRLVAEFLARVCGDSTGCTGR
jgi:hypothetical protein